MGAAAHWPQTGPSLEGAIVQQRPLRLTRAEAWIPALKAPVHQSCSRKSSRKVFKSSRVFHWLFTVMLLSNGFGGKNGFSCPVLYHGTSGTCWSVLAGREGISPRQKISMMHLYLFGFPGKGQGRTLPPPKCLLAAACFCGHAAVLFLTMFNLE